MFRIGRTSLVIGVDFLAMLVAAGDFVASRLKDGSFGETLRRGFLIGGWVAMWRPLRGLSV